MVLTCKIFCGVQLGAVVISSSTLVTARVTSEKTGNAGSFYSFSEILFLQQTIWIWEHDLRDHKPRWKPAQFTGKDWRWQSHRPLRGELQSSLCRSHTHWTPGKSRILTHSWQKKKKESLTYPRGCGTKSRHPGHLKFSSQQNQWERCCWGAWLLLTLLCGELVFKGTSCPEELVNPARSRDECSQWLDCIYSVKPVIESN